MTKELNLRTTNPDRYVRIIQSPLILRSDAKPPQLTLSPVGHHTRLLHHLRNLPATHYDLDALLRPTHLACHHHACLGRGDDLFWFCQRLDGTCGPSLPPRRPRGP